MSGLKIPPIGPLCLLLFKKNIFTGGNRGNGGAARGASLGACAEVSLKMSARQAPFKNPNSPIVNRQSIRIFQARQHRSGNCSLEQKNRATCVLVAHEEYPCRGGGSD
jgi:hypothetical protein